MTDNAHQHQAAIRPVTFWVGVICLVVGALAAMLLVGKELNVLQAPGCGGGSPCDRATASVWGRVPGLGWPTSFVGLAYFAALLVAWSLDRRGGVSTALVWTVRVGGVASVALIGVMVANGYLCPYCLAVHLGNFGFLGAVELSPVTPRVADRSLAWGAAAFAVATGVLGTARGLIGHGVEEKRVESTQQIIEAAGGSDGRFTGRYLSGPENAPIRIVAISDYQCPDCRRVEAEIRTILEQRDDVSFSAKHFPMCMDCNPYAMRTLHSNACWAARAAETAGILRGTEGFFEMHHRLFDRGGSFTNAELAALLNELGYDFETFARIMQSDEALAPIREDIEEAITLGIHFTPMVFINGVELKGWNAHAAVKRTVEEVAASNPPAAGPDADRPPPASVKYIEDWRFQFVRPNMPDVRSWRLGPEDAPVSIVLWGDYQEPNTADADACIRELVAAGGVRYVFRHYPFNEACNPMVTSTRHLQACLAAKAAEAAGNLGGSDGYWAMHGWLFANQGGVTLETLQAAAETMGMHPPALLAHLEADDVQTAIAEDCTVASNAGLRGIPLIFVNNKLVPRWRRNGVCILPTLVEEAAN